MHEQNIIYVQSIILLPPNQYLPMQDDEFVNNYCFSF